MSMLIDAYRFDESGIPIGGPIVLDQSATNINASTTIHNVNMPSASLGDLRLVFVCKSSTGAMNPPAGWSSLTQIVASGSAVVWQVFYRSSEGLEGGGTDVFTTSVNQLAVFISIVIQSGTWQGTPENSGVSASTNSPDPPSLTPSFGAGNTLWFACFAGRYNQAITAFPYPNGNINATLGSSSTSGRQLGSSWSIISSATENPIAYTTTGTSDNRLGITVAVQAA